MSDLSDKTTIVVGASRGLGRGIAAAFADTGAPVVAVARSGPALAEQVGSALVELVRGDPASTAPGYLLTGVGLQKLP
jgi:NAD(P)-dependent dehydrogenase (short-subunit alcohol dehydrogenase family)